MSIEESIKTMAASRRRCDVDEIACWSIDNSFFKSWTFWRAEMIALPPLPLHLAASGSHVVLLEREEGFKPLTEAEPVTLGSAARAVTYVETFLRMAWPSAQLVKSIDDVVGRGSPGTSEDDDAIAAPAIGPPQGSASGAGYVVDLFVVDDGSLFRCSASIDPQGAITLEPIMTKEGLSCFSVTE
jgi:hypothetical protein